MPEGLEGLLSSVCARIRFGSTSAVMTVTAHITQSVIKGLGWPLFSLAQTHPGCRHPCREGFIVTAVYASMARQEPGWDRGDRMDELR